MLSVPRIAAFRRPVLSADFVRTRGVFIRQQGEAPGGLCKPDKLALDGGRNHNLMENGIQQILVPDQREIENDRGVRDNNHTPRMRSMAARSLCRSLTE